MEFIKDCWFGSFILEVCFGQPSYSLVLSNMLCCVMIEVFRTKRLVLPMTCGRVCCIFVLSH